MEKLLVVAMLFVPSVSFAQMPIQIFRMDGSSRRPVQTALASPLAPRPMNIKMTPRIPYKQWVHHNVKAAARLSRQEMLWIEAQPGMTKYKMSQTDITTQSANRMAAIQAMNRKPRVVVPDPKKVSKGPTLSALRPPMTPTDPKSDMSAEAEKNWDIVTGETRDKVIEKFACDVADSGEKVLMSKKGEAAKAADKLSQASTEKAAATKELQKSSVDLAKARSNAAARTGTPAQMAEREASLTRAENRAAKAFAKTAQAEAREALARGSTKVAAKLAGKQLAKQVVKRVLAGAATVVSRAGTYLIMFDATSTAPAHLDHAPPGK